jgi:hypothetical protein
MTFAIGLGLAGLAVSGFSAIMGGQQQAAALKAQKAGMQYQAQAANYEAQVAGQNAAAARTAGEVKANQLREQQRRLEGSVRAGYGAAGVTGAGTPLEVMNENTRLMEQDLINQNYNTEVQVQTYQNQAAQLRSGAGFYNSAANYYGGMAPAAATAGYLGAGSTLLGGAYKFLSSRPSFGPDLSGSEAAAGVPF